MRGVFLACALASAVAAGAQELPVQNGRVEVRNGLTIARAIETLGAGHESAWLAWRVPMVPGDRDLCSMWTDDRTTVRGTALEATDAGRPVIQAPAGPVVLEAASTLVIFARTMEGRIERLRVVGANCPVDAGGRTIALLNIPPADSVRALDALTGEIVTGVTTTRRVADAAVSAIALHDDPAADSVLDRLVAGADAGLRQRAATELGALRGAHGVAALTTRLAAERDPDTRRNLIIALAASPDPGISARLLDLARTDADPRVRGESAYRYVRRQGPSKTTDVLSLLNTATDDSVRRRIVSGIAGWPEAACVPVLIDLTRSHANLAVRKEAASALSRSKDQRAIAYFESVLR